MTTIELKAMIGKLSEWHDYLSDGPDGPEWEMECRACCAALRSLADVRDERQRKADILELQLVIDPWDGAYPSDYVGPFSGAIDPKNDEPEGFIKTEFGCVSEFSIPVEFKD